MKITILTLLFVQTSSSLRTSCCGVVVVGGKAGGSACFKRVAPGIIVTIRYKMSELRLN